MDWYDRIQHDLGCSLAYIRDFVSSDMICSCYQSALDTCTTGSQFWWSDLIVYPMGWNPSIPVAPYYSTGALDMPKKKHAGPFGL